MKKLGIFKYFILSIFVFTIIGCSLTDNDNPVPAFLIINDVSVLTKENQGDPTHQITEVWVYVNNDLRGVFPIPARVPVIVGDEPTDFIIFPGIRNNGETARSFTYNLMSPIEFTEDLAPGDELEISPRFSYKDIAKFDFAEGFESSTHIFTLDLDGDEETKIVSTSEDKIAGNQSGKISLTASNPFVSSASIFNFAGNNNAGSDSYLEMDYRNDVEFIVGIIYIENNQEITEPLIVLNAKPDWNKIYIDFTQILVSPTIESYRIYLTTNLDPLEVDSGEIFIDNLKFVHF